MSGKKEQVARIVFHDDPAIPLKYVHGGWGGVSPRGDIAVHFYQDIVALPEHVALVKADEGLREEESAPGKVANINRTVVTKIVMTPNVALSVAKWLEEKANEALSKMREAIEVRPG